MCRMGSGGSVRAWRQPQLQQRRWACCGGELSTSTGNKQKEQGAGRVHGKGELKHWEAIRNLESSDNTYSCWEKTCRSDLIADGQHCTAVCRALPKIMASRELIQD